MSSSSTSCSLLGLQSSLAVEPRVLRLRLAAPPNIIPSSSASVHRNAGEPRGVRTFLQCIATTAAETNFTTDYPQIYNPTAAHSAALSKHSLEMCTESLGSETGTDDPCSSDDELILQSCGGDGFGQLRPEESETATRTRTTTRSRMQRRGSGRRLEFPPPLSSTGVQMRSCREDGRLVVTAVEIPSCRAKFQAERTNGRLRLHITTTDYHCPNQEEEEEEEEEEEGAEDEKTERNEVGRRSSGRCKEETEDDGNRGLLTWEPFWVST